jgi:hypothetical protein
MLNYGDYWSGWGFHFGASLVITDTPDVQFEVAGVYNIDDASAGGSVIVVLRKQNSSKIHFVAIPRSDILTNGGVQTPILDKYPNASCNNVDSSSIGFAGDCLVAYSYDSHALVRYQLTPPFKEISRLPVGQNVHPLTYAYTADGSYSVQFDQTMRILTKVAKWW